MSRREYDPEVKAAVMAALLAGQSIRQIEQETGVPKSTVAAWGKETGELVPSVRDILDTKKERIRGLLVDLFIAKLESQISMSQHAADKDWQRKQDASAFAMLLGVSDDKLFRMLERFESARSEPESATN